MSYLAATTLMLSLAISSLAQAQNVDLKKLKEPVKPPRSGERANAGGMKACPEYGAGFYKMAGSDTCIRIGGAVDVGAGMSGTRR
jgi:hypothetical protein